MITGIEVSKILLRYISYNCKWKFDCRKYNNDKCQYDYKKTVKHHVSKKVLYLES